MMKVMKMKALFCSFFAHALGDSQDKVAQKKVAVKEVLFDSTIDMLHWAGPEHKAVLALTQKGRLYRSADSGQTWTDISEQIVKSAPNGVSGSSEEYAYFDRLSISPASKDTILAVGKKRSHFISEDAGNTWRKLKQEATIHNFVFHPTKPKLALLSSWTDACRTKNDIAASAGPCNHMLFVTQDLGLTFQLISSYVVQFAWAETKAPNTNRVYFSHFRQKQGTQPRLHLWSDKVDFCYTDDFGSGITTAVQRGNKFGVFNGFIFVAQLHHDEKQSVKLVVSTNEGKSFDTARLDEEIDEKSYTILDSSEGAVVLHVHHGDKGTGTIYISDGDGLRYTKSLANNVRSLSGECDFDKGGFEGVYIANVMINENDRHLDALAEESEENAAGDKLDRKKKHGTEEIRIATLITYNKGGTWQPISPPTYDSLGEKITCEDGQGTQCSLHLHGLTNVQAYPPYYSVERATGIIMATGNVGESLRMEEGETNTFTSIDAGQTWIETHKKPYIYEIGDHGGLLIMAATPRRTSQVIFSWNEGMNWYEFELTSRKMTVDNIVTEPDSVSTQFLLYGTRGGSQGVMFFMDFEALGMPRCANPQAAGSVSSDYYNWNPTDGTLGSKCLLGREHTITRRKPTSECFNGVQFERDVQGKPCQCTKMDFECELGFARAPEKVVGDPIPDCTLFNDNTAAPLSCYPGSKITVNAYRKIPGDGCEGGWTPETVDMICPLGHGGTSLTNYLMYGSILFVFAYLLYKHCSHVPMQAIEYLMSSAPWMKVGGQGFETFNSIKYSTIQLDHMPENALESAGVRYDAEFMDDPLEEEMAPNLVDFDIPSPEPAMMPKVSRGLDTAAEFIPRLGAPTRDAVDAFLAPSKPSNSVKPPSASSAAAKASVTAELEGLDLL